MKGYVPALLLSPAEVSCLLFLLQGSATKAGGRLAVSEADNTKGSSLVLVFEALEAQRPYWLIYVPE